MPIEPPRDCPLCPRLHGFRHENRARFPEYFNDPVPSFGPSDAPLLIVGLAPGLHGANRTGRPFTGDHAGLLLYGTLKKHGLARGDYGERADDGLTLVGCAIANAVRCVPPENRPLPAEIRTCRQFLSAQIKALPHLRAILCLGKIAHGRKRTRDVVEAGGSHRDHRTVAGVTLDCVYPLARDHLSFPELMPEFEPHKTLEIHLMQWENPQLVVDITDVMDLKIKALACHASQFADFAGVEQRIRERSAELGKPKGYAYAETFDRIVLAR